MQAERLRGTLEKACEECGAEMILVRHARTQNVMALDKLTVEQGLRFEIEHFPNGTALARKTDGAGHESHHATCPSAKRRRS